MVHASSINCSDTVRQAVIARFHSTKYGLALLSDDGGVASDGNLWKYWGPEVREGPEPDPAAVEGFAASWQLLDSPPPAVRHPLDRGEGDLERCASQHPSLPRCQRAAENLLAPDLCRFGDARRWRDFAEQHDLETWQGPVWAKL